MKKNEQTIEKCEARLVTLKKDAERVSKIAKFEKELRVLINSHSMENGSNTPDYVLASYLVRCLTSFNDATIRRAEHSMVPCMSD